MREEAEAKDLWLEVKNVYKTYDGVRFVLNGINMSVPKGAIYGLLGSSGCGKSTLLNSIVGLMQLDAGEIRIPSLGKKDIGFMPQELSLHDTMKTEEVFYYFGTLFEMKKELIEERIAFLTSLLQLPKRKRLLKTFSGGELRRVSLAVSFMHNPKLMILDEPTVGVDPVLRQSIWDHLLKLCNENKMTIIITTHYIEETKQAHIVGLMREGVLLCEESPKSVMTRLGCNSLEEAFLVLSKQQALTGSTNQEENQIKITKFNKVLSPLSKNDKLFSFPRFKAELMKNYFFLSRNIPLLLYLFGLPIVSCLLFNIGIGYEPNNLRFGAVIDDIPFDTLTGCERHLKEINQSCNMDYLSCQYLYEMEKTNLNLKVYDYLDEGLEAIKKNDIWGLAYFPQNFTRNLGLRIEFGKDAGSEAVDNSLVDIYLDRSNRVIDELINLNIRSSFRAFIESLFSRCGWQERASDIPINFKKPIYGILTPTFRDYAAPAIVVVILFSMPLVYGVVIIIEEKNSGTTGRSIAAGVNLLEVLLAHSVIQVSLQAIQTCSTMFMMFYIYEFQFMRPFLSTILLFLQGVTGVSLAFVIAIACDNLPIASACCTFSVISSIVLGGMIWPSQGIHPILKPISIVMPITLPVESLRGLTQRGWGLSYPPVWLGFLTCICWTIFFIFIVYLILRKAKAKAFLSKKIR
ncbi:unnamed protein product [Nezara viridula]|uniref:ABC transporter domain-containing protein n=1 Tax=Nezara viridula TaxID=85310 RepID=A0A9P0EAI1_NEZVI|nr:unnamed protein product [Nezara viridula]